VGTNFSEFEYGYRLKGKNDWALDFLSKYIEEYLNDKSRHQIMPFIELDEIVLRDTKNFHYLFWKSDILSKLG